MTRRVVLAHENPAWGGTENYLAGLASGLAVAPHDLHVTLIVPASMREEWQRKSGPHVAVESMPPGLVARTALLRRLAPDLVHVNDPQPKTVAAARLAGIRSIVTTYHTPSLVIDYNARARLLWRFGAHRSHFVVLTPQNKADVVAKLRVPADRAHVVALGLDQTRFEGLAGRAKMRAALSIPEDAFVAICAGRLEPQKAHEVLLEAWAKAVHLRPGSVLLIAGGGTRQAELEALATKLGVASSVRFLGFVRSMPETIEAADVHVMSSDFEGLPAVILEAMALGIPTVSTAVDGIKDLLTPELGILVPVRDPARLGDALVAVAHDDARRRAMGTASRRKFLADHGVDAMVAGTASIYEHMLRARGS